MVSGRGNVKKVLVVTAVLVLALGIIGCAQTQTPSSQPYTPAPIQTPPTQQQPAYQSPAPPSYKPPVQSSQRENYLRQAESYQRMASSALDDANRELGSANSNLQMSNTPGMADFQRQSYRQHYEQSMRRYQGYMEDYARYQKMANEYMLKAQREP